MKTSNEGVSVSSSKCVHCGHVCTCPRPKSLDMCAHWQNRHFRTYSAKTVGLLVSALYRLTKYIFIPNTREPLCHTDVHDVHMYTLLQQRLVSPLGAEQ